MSKSKISVKVDGLEDVKFKVKEVELLIEKLTKVISELNNTEITIIVNDQ